MKRIPFMAAVCLAMMVGLMLNGQQTVSADGAIVIHDSGVCGMPGADINGDMIFGGEGNTFLFLENGNKVTIKCKGDVINDSGNGQHYDGFECGIITADQQLVVTTNTHATVSASGVGTMTCTYTKQ